MKPIFGDIMGMDSLALAIPHNKHLPLSQQEIFKVKSLELVLVVGPVIKGAFCRLEMLSGLLDILVTAILALVAQLEQTIHSNLSLDNQVSFKIGIFTVKAHQAGALACFMMMGASMLAAIITATAKQARKAAIYTM